MYREFNKVGYWYSDSKDDRVKIESMSPPQLHNTISKCERYIREIKDPRIVEFYKIKLAELEFYLA